MQGALIGAAAASLLLLSGVARAQSGPPAQPPPPAAPDDGDTPDGGDTPDVSADGTPILDVSADGTPILDAPDGAPADAQPIEVRVIGDRADAMQKIPGSGTMIRPRELERARPLNAAEMLRRVPGVNVRQDQGAGGRLDIGLRGLDPGRSRRVLLLEDGVPISNNPYAEPDLYWSPPVERWHAIEVVKGSGSILFGPQTVGGVINFITPFAPYRREVRLEARGGQRGFVHAFGRYGDSHGDVRYLGQVLFRRGDGFRAQGFRTVDSFAKLSVPTSHTGVATLKLGIHDTVADADDVGLTSAMYAADPRRLTLSPNNEARLRRYSASLIHEERFNDIVTLRTLAYLYALGRQWRRQDYTRVPVPGERYTRILGDVNTPGGAIFFRDQNRVLDRDYLVGGVEPRLSLRFSTGAIGHTVDAGARVLAERAHYEQRQGETPQSYAGTLLLDEARDTIAAAAYVQDRLAFLDERILVTPGLRLEYARYKRTIARQPTADGAEDVAIEGSNDSLALLPGIGMTAGTPDIHGFAGFHLGYAPPRVSSSIRANGASEQLDDERSLAYEAGARVKQGRLWSLSATGFLTNFANQIVPSSVGAVTTLVNGGSTRHMGLEGAGNVSFGQLIEHGVLLDLSARYTLMRATFVGGDKDGLQLPYAPNHMLNANLDAGHAFGLSAQLSYSYIGRQYTDDRNTEAEDVSGRSGLIAGYHRLDANLRYHEKHSGLTGTISIKDLLDRPFIISRRPEGIFAAGFRQVMFGLRWDYRAEPAL